ncbi:MAG TPA: DMT family transporter [Candidatus Dormibacteraeota bacterium]
MVLASAVAFGTIPILGKYAYANGVTPLQLLAFRFVIASAGLSVIAFAVGQRPWQLGPVRSLPVALMGLVYAATALSFFTALTVMPASLMELIAYIYPALVAIGAWLFVGGEMNRRIVLALVLTFVGLALLVGAVQLRAGWALLLAFASPLFYSVYILAGERATAGVPTVVSSVLVHVGGAITMVAVLLVVGPRTLPASAAAWAVVTAVALLPSMVGISLFLAGLARVGATRAAIMSTVEPAVTVALAAALLGDRLNGFQGAGAVLVVAAVILMQWRRREAIPPFEP